MLQDILRAKGLVLESEELLGDRVNENAPEADELLEMHQEISADAAEVDTAEEVTQSLEALCLAFESMAGERTALEAALFKHHVNTQLGRIGLATSEVSFESLDGTGDLALEGVGETIMKVAGAVKESFAAARAKIKDFISSIRDWAGKTAKKFQEYIGKVQKDGVLPRRYYSWAGKVANEATPVQIYGDLSKATKMVLVDYAGKIREGAGKLNATFRQKAVIPWFLYDPQVYFDPTVLGHAVKFDGLKLPGKPEINFSATALGRWSNLSASGRWTVTSDSSGKADIKGETISKEDVVKVLKSAIEVLNMVSVYHRDWRGFEKEIETIMAKLDENTKEANAEKTNEKWSANATKRNVKLPLRRLWSTTTEVPRSWMVYVMGALNGVEGIAKSAM